MTYTIEDYMDDVVNETEVKCTKCGWLGLWSDLDIGDNHTFELCPECKSDEIDII
jgi:Zn finger protein HypA/HybF involved in hydrogenase expression